MKIFSFAKQPQEILGKKFPANTIYGHIMLNYTVKIPTGKTYRVTDKQGHLIIDKMGNPIIRHCTRAENRKQEIYYAVQDFQPQSFKDGTYFRAWIKTDLRNKWHETPLMRNAWMKELNSFIAGKMQENGVNLTHAWFNTPSQVHTNKAHETALSAAHRREVQTDYLFKGYGLNSGTINEEVRFAPSGASVKGVFARHKDAFGVKSVNDPKKDAPEPLKHGFVCVNGKNSRVVYPTAEMAEAAGHIYKHGKGDDAGTCLDSNKVMNVCKV